MNQWKTGNGGDVMLILDTSVWHMFGGVSQWWGWMETCVVRSGAFCSNVHRGRRTREACDV